MLWECSRSLEPYSRGGQPFAQHTPIFSSLSNLPMRYSIGYLVTMPVHIVSGFPGNDVRSKRNIWLSGKWTSHLLTF